MDDWKERASDVLASAWPHRFNFADSQPMVSVFVLGTKDQIEPKQPLKSRMMTNPHEYLTTHRRRRHRRNFLDLGIRLAGVTKATAHSYVKSFYTLITPLVQRPKCHGAGSQLGYSW